MTVEEFIKKLWILSGDLSVSVYEIENFMRHYLRKTDSSYWVGNISMYIVGPALMTALHFLPMSTDAPLIRMLIVSDCKDAIMKSSKCFTRQFQWTAK